MTIDKKTLVIIVLAAVAAWLAFGPKNCGPKYGDSCGRYEAKSCCSAKKDKDCSDKKECSYKGKRASTEEAVEATPATPE